MAGLLTYQPFKAIYALLAAAFEAARFPLWILLYISSSGRPHKKWTLRQAIGVRIIRQFVYHSAAVEVVTPYNLKPGSEKERFVTCEPAPGSMYKGPLQDKQIKPLTTGGTWTPKPITPAEIETGNIDVVLHFHGGAYVLGDGRDADTSFLAKTLLKHARVTHVFTPNYRLSCNAGGRFPAAFQDAVTCYYHLVKTLKIPSDRITISGDSAGGNLAFALLRYLTEYGKDVGLPLPGCAWFWSPWVNVEEARNPEALHNSKQYSTDYLTAPFAMWGARMFAPLDQGLDTTSPYITPIGHPFMTPVPIWVSTGRAEVLYDDNKAIAEQFEKLGNKVSLHVIDNVPHDIILLGHILGFTREAAAAAKNAGEFLQAERARL
ncbi:uncharacterized protein PV09_09428 [Verruconis gallopava]|uniref:Alpha/beta hydrolase fold-3 domain-containing protein n=1 Tax=Verruconis gallopava TaxID=253628 RepID=A0A0D1ZXK5_9PEZI|nr:uncharacterized protein PV09_09428 [Verruconis gallopava]KIV98814.1 hypothetical protein PV09_09428 [Verruconis gallopava]